MFDTGLDIINRNGFKNILGQRVAILANQASVNKNFEHILDLAINSNIRVTKLFAPEHGFYGTLQDMEHVGFHTHEKYKIPIISLYGDHKESLKIKTNQLDDIDVLLCDLTDIGSRYYTFHCTIAWAMAACQEKQVKLVVLDRPNPINANNIEGNLIKEANFSFVGAYPILNRHGFTMGELVSYIKKFYDLDLDIEIIKLENYDRTKFLDDLGGVFIQPSPNMPNLDTAMVYPGLCLIEGTNLSEGRGTTTPFLTIGAPFIDAAKLKSKIDNFDLPGVNTRTIRFRPQFNKYAGQECEGIFIHIIDRQSFKPLRFGIAILKAAMEFPGFKWRTEAYEYEHDRPAIDLLLGDQNLRTMIEQKASLCEIFKIFDEEEKKFSQERKKYLLY